MIQHTTYNADLSEVNAVSAACMTETVTKLNNAMNVLSLQTINTQNAENKVKMLVTVMTTNIHLTRIIISNFLIYYSDSHTLLLWTSIGERA